MVPSNPVFKKNYTDYLQKPDAEDFSLLPSILDINVNEGRRIAQIPFSQTNYQVSTSGVVDGDGKRADYDTCVILLKYLLMCPRHVPRGFSVRLMVRNIEKAAEQFGEDFKIVQGDITDRLTFQDVDYQGNKNLLETALRAGVEKFIYVSVFNGPDLRHFDIVKAHEDFVDDLKTSGMKYAVVRPTGYFSDMTEFLKMARKGRVYLIGPGTNRCNPIHGADLAKTCANVIAGQHQEIDVGGPQAMTYREIAELAFRSVGRKGRISSVPVWLMKSVVAVTRIFNRHQGELLAFFTTAMTSDVVAPSTGIHTLVDYYKRLAAEA